MRVNTRRVKKNPLLRASAVLSLEKKFSIKSTVAPHPHKKAAKDIKKIILIELSALNGSKTIAIMNKLTPATSVIGMNPKKSFFIRVEGPSRSPVMAPIKKSFS